MIYVITRSFTLNYFIFPLTYIFGPYYMLGAGNISI